jgi:hypothetical protein
MASPGLGRGRSDQALLGRPAALAVAAATGLEPSGVVATSVMSGRPIPAARSAQP